jgi:hypothetical protein
VNRPEEVGTVCDGFIHSLESSGELKVSERVKEVRIAIEVERKGRKTAKSRVRGGRRRRK